MAHTKKKQRTIYAFSTTIYQSNDDKSHVNFTWNSNHIKAITKKIMDLPEADRRRVDSTAEWTMHLYKCEVDPLKPNIMTGAFLSTKQGLHTKIQHIQTGDIKDNPKPPGYNEIRTTCFSLRFSDGLFMLADYGGNVATAPRIAEYFTKFSEKLCPELNVSGFQFDHLISKDFIEKLNAFERINTLEILVDTTKDQGVDDALSTLNAELADIQQGKLLLVLQRGDYPTLSAKGIYNWYNSKANKHTILQGKIKGKPAPGNPKELRLSGMEEKYPQQFPLDKDEDVLTEPLFEFIIKITEERPTIK